MGSWSRYTCTTLSAYAGPSTVGSIKDVIAKTSVAWKEWRAVIKTDILGFPAREASTLNSLVQHEPGNTTA